MRTALRVAAVLLWAICSAARADEVRLRHAGLTLNGVLELAKDRAITDGVVLMVHGTLAHRDMEVIHDFRRILKERGISTLAVNLSLGVDDRHGMYDCAVPHRHRHEDAVGEIAAWVGWLKDKGARRVTVLGHSRGGSQVAWYVGDRAAPPVDSVVLLGTLPENDEDLAAAYEKRHGKPLAPLVTAGRMMQGKGMGEAVMKETGFLYCAKAAVSVDAFLSYYATEARRDSAYWLPRLKVPVLVLVAGSDEVVKDPTPIRKAAEGRAGIEVRVIAGSDHFFRDINGEEAADAIAAFLAR